MSALGLGALVVVIATLARLHAMDVHGVGAALRSIGAGPLGLGVAGALGVAALQSLRWWIVTRPVVRVRYVAAYAIWFVAGLLNLVIPLRGGDLLRVQYLARRLGASPATLYGAEAVDALTDKSGWLPAFVALGLSGAPPAWMLRVVVAAGTIAVAFLGAVLLVRRRLAATTSGADPGGEGWQRRFARGLASSSPRRIAVAVGLFAALPWIWEALAIHCVAGAAGLSVAPLQAFVVLTAFNLALLLPVPGGVGVHEAASTAVLVSIGVPVDRAVAFAVAYHATQLAPYAVGGAVGLLLVRRAPFRAESAGPLPPVGVAS